MRGDLYRIEPRRDAVGHEQRGPRYAVMLQADHLRLSTTIVAPTSTAARPTSFRPEIEINGKATQVMIDQMMAVDHTRLGEFAGRLDAREMAAVDLAVKDVLSLLT